MQFRSPVVFALLAVAVAGLVFSTGCPRHIAEPDDALESPQQLRGAVDARVDQVQDARFRNITMEYFGEGERVRVRQLILVERPDRLRVQTRLPASDEIANLLVSDGDTFAMHNRDTNEYLTGRPTRENINRLLPVNLSSRDVVDVMLGAAPWDRFDDAAGEPQLEWDGSEGTYRYFVETDDGHTLSMYVRHNDFAVVSVEETDDDGEMVYSFTTENWQSVDGVNLPTYRRFQWPDRDLDFSLDVSDTELNIGFDDNLFDFPPPPGSTVIELQD